MIKEYITYG